MNISLYTEQVLIGVSREEFINSFEDLFSFDNDFLGNNEVRFSVETGEAIFDDEEGYNVGITGIKYMSEFARRTFWNETKGEEIADYGVVIDLVVKKVMEEYQVKFLGSNTMFNYNYSRVGNQMAISTVCIHKD